MNLIAMDSHIMELVNSIQLEEWDTFPEEEFLLSISENAINMRRNVMRDLIKQSEALWNEVNNKYWCLLKHAMATYNYTLEVYQSETDEKQRLKWFYIQLDASRNLFLILSKFLWLPNIAVCGRCLLDELTDNTKK
jgi:hypothetical protein